MLLQVKILLRHLLRYDTAVIFNIETFQAEIMILVSTDYAQYLGECTA